jgi:glycine dehydrogenase subunit 2
MEIGIRLKEFRERKKIKMPAIEAATGISKENLYKWEKGTKPSDVNDYLKLKAYLDEMPYGDGANFNAILGIVKPGAVGFDFMHYNLHKTFTTPHGGGGPGSGAVGCIAELAKFLPGPRVRLTEGMGDGGWGLGDAQTSQPPSPIPHPPTYEFFTPEKSIGPVKTFWGNFGMLVRAWTYIRTLGAAGLREVSEVAVLNANYLRVKLQGTYPPAYDRICMHETVLKGQISEAPQARTLDIAKRLIDYGFHPPTVYFPLIVPEALMIEPTETESKRNMDAFVDAMLSIADEARRDIEILRQAPTTAPVRRVDEVRAARQPILKYNAEKIAKLRQEAPAKAGQQIPAPTT